MNNQEIMAIRMAYDYLRAVANWGDDEDSYIGEILELAVLAEEAADNLAEVFADVAPIEDEQEVVS